MATHALSVRYIGGIRYGDPKVGMHDAAQLRHAADGALRRG